MRARKAGAKQPPRLDGESLSQHDQEVKERQCIADRLVQALREAGYSCHSGDARTLRRDD
jgi:hypothetical protein